MFARRSAVALLTGLILAATAVAQESPAQNASDTTVGTKPAYVPTMTFDVASVRETNPGVEAHRVGGGFTPHTTNLKFENVDLSWLILTGFGVDYHQISGQPDWVGRATFNVQAKSDAAADEKMATLDKDQEKLEQQHMVQALLADRFKLKVHWETKERDIYDLVVAKGGSKLGAEGSMPPTADELKWFGDHPVRSLYQRNDGEGYDFFAHGCAMEQLVSMLGGMFGRPVIDKTGLTGKYDFVLKYKGRWDSDRKADDMDPLPPMDRAIQQYLGLKVETAKGPVQVLVIDHVEKPSEN